MWQSRFPGSNRRLDSFTAPQLKRIATRQGRTLVFVDESGFYLLPSVVKAYGRKGRTPAVDEWQTRDHLSVMGGLTTDGRVCTLARQDPLTGVETVAFLEHRGGRSRAQCC